MSYDFPSRVALDHVWPPVHHADHADTDHDQLENGQKPQKPQKGQTMPIVPDTAFDPDRAIEYGVNQPGVYDGVLYWVDTNGYAYHRFMGTVMKARAQPFIDAHNAGRAFLDIQAKQDKTDKS